MKKNSLNKLALLTTLFVTTATSADAQLIESSAGASLVSSYVWRGQDMGGVSIQPTASLSMSNFTLTAWGSVGFDNSDTKEFDFTFGYKRGRFNVAITDYWFNTLDAKGNENNYYSFVGRETAHVYEATAGYDFGPLAIVCNTNFAGNDYKTGADTTRAYSTYIEVSVPFRLGGLNMNAEWGFTPAEGLYSDDFNVINVALTAQKKIMLTESFALPAFTKVVFNPNLRYLRFVFGITF